MADAAVTGAASGIGAATARLLSARGMRVALLDVRLDAARAEVEAIGGDAYAVELDVTDPRSVTGAFAAMQQLSVLVNGAGVVVVDAFAPSATTTGGAHTRSTCWGRTASCSRRCRRSEQGRRRRASSTSPRPRAQRAAPLLAPYAASKAAVISLTRSAAAAWAPGILVNCVCPGLVDTPMWEAIDARLEGIGAPPGARYAQRARNLPVGRAATPDEEVAAAVAYLCGPDAGSITGSDLNVDGGLSIS